MGILRLQSLAETLGGFAQDPVTALTVGATIISAGAGAIGQHNQGVAAQQQADYQAQISGLQGQIAQKNAAAQQQELEYEAGQARTQAGQERAASQQKEIIQQRQTAIGESRARALAAAGGGLALDPSVVNIMGDLQTEGDYRAATDKYQGEDAARGLEDTASLKTYQGKLAKAGGDQQAAIQDASASMYRTSGANSAKAGNLNAFSTIISGAGNSATMYDKYSTGNIADGFSAGNSFISSANDPKWVT